MDLAYLIGEIIGGIVIIILAILIPLGLIYLLIKVIKSLKKEFKKK